MSAFLHRWGQFLLAALCVLAILFAALYTRQDELRAAARLAAADENQTLQEAQSTPRWQAPLAGAPLQRYQGAQRAADSGLWHFSPYTLYSARPGQAVCAPGDGVVAEAGDDRVALRHGDGLETRLLDLCALRVRPGETVRAGQEIASAQSDTLRAAALLNGEFIDFETLFSSP